MDTLTKLNIELLKADNDKAAVQTKIQEYYNGVFEKDTDLKKDLALLEASREYGSNDFEIYRWARLKHFRGQNPTSYGDAQYRECLRVWLYDVHCAAIDFGNSCLTTGIGDCLIVGDDGVYACDMPGCSKQVIDSSEYTEDGEVNEKLRNKLIEAHMEKTGWYPDVLRETRNGDLFPLNTQSKEKKK